MILKYEDGVFTIDDLDRVLVPADMLVKKQGRKKDDAITYVNRFVSYDTETSSWRENPATGEIFTQSDFLNITRERRDELHAETKPRACVYAFMVCIDSTAFLMRTWEEFIRFCRKLVEYYELNPYRRLRIAVQNLSYEFQFMAHRFNWLRIQQMEIDPDDPAHKRRKFKHGEYGDEAVMIDDVFSTKDRNVIRAVTEDGLEFFDTLILSKCGLKNMAKQIRERKDVIAAGGFQIDKLNDDMDYRNLRFSETPLTDLEKEYCGNDVKILNAWYSIKADDDGDLTKIPMTDTGYVRRHTRKKCLTLPYGQGRKWTDKRGRVRVDTRNTAFINKIHQMRLDYETYKLAREAFRGGHTHANATAVGRDYFGPGKYDFTSDYPTQMIARLYPMSSPKYVPEIRTFEDVKKWQAAGYAVMFRCRVHNLKERVTFEHILSESKCHFFDLCGDGPHSACVHKCNGYCMCCDKCDKQLGSIRRIDNGRVVYAEDLMTAMTDVDLLTFELFYTWDAEVVWDAYVMVYDYLPKEIIESTLDFYYDKCTLKGDPDHVREFMKAKGMLNSEFGMMVMDIVRPIITFDDGWNIEQVNDMDMAKAELAIEHYNRDPNRFTFYPWGVWVTAWARFSLLTGIYNLGHDFLYADTDSVVVANYDKHLDYFEAYNEDITRQVNACLDHYGIPREKACPVIEKDGKKKSMPIGVWDFEGELKQFKTWGAKRYLSVHKNKEGDWELEATVAGVNKKNYTKFLEESGDPFETFKPGNLVPHVACNRLTCCYVDPGIDADGKKIGYRGAVTDYLGNLCHYEELSFVYMEPSDYMMTLGSEFERYLANIRN